MAFPKPSEFLESVSLMRNTRVFETKKHLELAAKWLLNAQTHAGEGYAHSYDLMKGWSPAYPETTGYIISSMLKLSEKLKDSKLSDSAFRAGEWLLKIQNQDGSFSDLRGKKHVFDTGQVIYGFLALYYYSKDNKWINASVRAAKWIISVQEENGSWVKNAYNEVPHTYYSRVGSILLQLGIQTNDQLFVAAGKKNLQWVISRQSEDGYFSDMAFMPGTPPYLHTIVYVLEGLLHSYFLTKDKVYLDSALKTAEQIRKISSERDFILHSQYSEGWKSVNSEKCSTGIAQWAGVCLHLFDITKESKWKDEAVKHLYYLKSKQVSRGGQNTIGAIPSSIPIWGKYGKFSFFNWNSKFFIDALMSLDRLFLPLWMEQQIYVQEAFKFNEKKYYDPNAKADYSIYHPYFEKALSKLNQGSIFADIGCGGGALLKEIGSKYPNLKCIGVDPSFFGEGIVQGSAYSTSLQDNSVDAILFKEVLQHIEFDEIVLSEIMRIAKNGAILIIIERNPTSLLGIRKPLYENINKWMYPSDSPFREKWHSESEWRSKLSAIGEILSFDKINIISGGRKVLAGLDSRFFFITVRLKKSPR